MGYSITIQDLLERPIIRDDFEDEWMNKMTDEELSQFERESYQLCLQEGTPEKYPDINAACLSKHIDRSILYKIIKESKNMETPSLVQLQQELLDLYEGQIADLTIMSKIELGDDVIEEIKRLKTLINEQTR